MKKQRLLLLTAMLIAASATKRKQRIRERINQSKEKPLDKNQSIDIYLWEY